MDMYHLCRFKRKVFVLSAMISGLMFFTLYTLSFSCCVVLNAGLTEQALRGSRLILVDPNDPDHPQKDYTQVRYDVGTDIRHGGEGGRVGGGAHHHRMARKTLLHHDHHNINNNNNNGGHHMHRMHAPPERRHIQQVLQKDEYDSPTEEDELNGYTVEDEREHVPEEEEGEEDYEDGTDPSDNTNNIKVHPHPKPSRTSSSTTSSATTTTTHKSQMVRTFRTGDKKLPQALIIGVKKGGTRALLEFLRIHPDIRAPGPEPHFFDRHYHRGLEWYRQQMPPTIEGQITIEKTPSYFVTKGVPGRIFNMSKNMKIIVVVRDPVTRAISDYTQAASKRNDVRPFEQMAFLDNSTGLVDTSWGAIRIGVYAKHLERWLKYFPLNQMFFVNGEKLITDPAGEMAKVQEFLGLKNVITEKHFYFNSTKGFPCLKKTEGSGNPHCLGKTKGRVHPEVDPKAIKRLRDFFRPFNAKFYQMTNQDFGWP